MNTCSGCHTGVESKDDHQGIRMSTTDYDGDGDAKEGVAVEIATMADALYVSMQAYGADVAGTDIVYDSHTYPYFFIDTNGNGTADSDEAAYANQYNAWTPRLLRAAYNYQYAAKDPGGFAHNGKYIMQALYDSLEDVGADVTELTRP